MEAGARNVFVTGATGYMGRRLIPELLKRGHAVRALVRRGSEGKLPDACPYLIGDPLDASTYASRVPPASTFMHLVGVSHPSPAKADQFRAVDLPAAQAAVWAATRAGVAHFIFVSVAHPAPVMQAYIRVRRECERILRESNLNATILRPWYVLGPGRNWPRLLLPLYWILQSIPATRESAQRLGLVTAEQMIAALVAAVENPATGVRILGVPEIRQAQNGFAGTVSTAA